MFVPFIPIARHIVNKTVVYCDTVIPLNNMGENIKVTTIDNISSYKYKDCINKVCETNPDVLFHTIQYSIEKKEVTFYTGSSLNLEGYYKWVKESNQVSYDIPKQNRFVYLCKEILKNDIPEISLFDYYSVLHRYNVEAQSNIKRLMECINSKMNCIDDTKDCRIKYMDWIQYKSVPQELIVKFDYRYSGDDYCILTIKKTENGQLYLAKASRDSCFCIPANDMFNGAFEYFFELYEFMKDYSRFCNLVPNHIFLENGLCISTCYTIDICNVTLSEETFFPKKYIKAYKMKIDIVGFDYYSLQEIKDAQYDIFKRINIPREELKNISFLFPEKSSIKTVKKVSFWDKLKNMF